MKITIYELLGLVKDGKAPKKVKYSGIEYEFNGKDYINEYGVNLLQHLTYAEYIMTHKVEIIEEKKIPEKLDLYEETQNIIRENNYKLVYHDIHKCIVSLECKYNQLIDYLNSKGE